MRCVGVCNLKLWRVGLLLFHVALSLHPSFARQDFLVQPIAPAGASGYYFYEHNETRVAQAMAEVEANFDGARSSSKYLDWNSSDGCYWDNRAVYLGVPAGRTWYAPKSGDFVDVQIIAVDACTYLDTICFGGHPIQISSEHWRTPNPEVDLVESRFKKVLVEIRAVGLEILGEGVYCPATGIMQLVGCILNVTSQDEQERWTTLGIPKLVASSGDYAVSLTLQYPPRHARWNWQRVLKFALRSTRDASDPLYFHPVKRDIFHLYFDGFDSDPILYLQAQLATGGRMLVLLLGLVCVVLQIQYGGHNEEALPFVSLAMLGIQIAHHVSQTSVFKDLQISRYPTMLGSRRRPIHRPSMRIDPQGESLFLHSTADFDYYGTMAWHAYVPYQAMAMAALFMYVWIFHRVGERRRIMQLRVRKGRSGAVDPPREGQLAFATVTLVAFVVMTGILANIVDRSSAFGEPGNLFGNVAGFWDLTHREGKYHFVSPRFYELWYAQWGVLNKVTGLCVSLFLVPQLLGNWRWDVQGRPLSRWFYVGLPLLQSLPPLFTIAKYFQLLPILAFYDPYLDSLYGIYQNPTPWWPMGEVSCSALLVVVVHLQFATSFRPSRANSPTDTSASFSNL